MLLRRLDPKEERNRATRRERTARGLEKTANQIVDEYLEKIINFKLPETGKFKNSYSYRSDTARLFNTYIPRDGIGTWPVQELTTKVLADAGLDADWRAGKTKAPQFRIELERFFRLATNWGYYRGENPATLEKFNFPPWRYMHTVKPRASLPYRDLPQFMVKLDEVRKRAAPYWQRGDWALPLLVKMVALTGARPIEARLATWGEFNLKKMIWNVPWGHRKSRDHIPQGEKLLRPITKEMLALLTEMQSHGVDQSPNAIVFPNFHGQDPKSSRGRPFISSAIPNFIVNTLRWPVKITAHGFRSTLRDFQRSHANLYPAIWWDFQVDHVPDPGNLAGQAYGPDKMLEERRRMMAHYDQDATRPPEAQTGDNVTQFPKKKRRA
jgi:integrase